MLQAVPNLLAIPPAPKASPPPPPSRSSESERTDFRDELGKAKKSRPAEKKEPSKTESKKPDRPDRPKSPQKAEKPQKEKDSQAADQGQDDTDQPQQDGQPSPQEGTADPQPQKKDAPHEAKKDKVTLQSQQDPTAAAPAAVVPKQAAVVKQPEPQKPEATETRKPNKAIVQRVGPAGAGDQSYDPAGAADGSPAQPDAGQQSAQKPDQPADPSAPAIPHLKLGEPVAAKPQSQANAVQASPDQSAAQAQLTDAQQQDLPDNTGQNDFADELTAAELTSDPPDKGTAKPTDDTPAAAAFTLPNTLPGKDNAKVAPATSDVQQPAPTEAQFAEANHARIVTGIHGQLLPNGGSMHLRLDPPELGALNVRVEMKDGVMTAAFETTNDQATKLLSHSLSDLKSALEAQGVAVEKLHVRQSQPEQQRGEEGRQRDPDRQQQQQANQEQQRKEMLRRMWRRLMKGKDPLDLVA